MNWDDLRILDAAIASPTLSAAARSLDMTVATVSRRLTALEQDLGIPLFVRTPSGISLTAEGHELAEKVRTAAGAVEALQRRADRVRQGQSHPIRISATESIATPFLAPNLPRLYAALPDVRIEVSISTDIVSLASRSADIAIRFAPPQGASLVAQRLTAFRLGLYASPAYLAGRDPAALDLREETLIAYDASLGEIAEVAWINRNDLSGAARVRASSTLFILNATRAGTGVGMLSEAMAARFPDLVRVPAPTPIPERPLWLVTHKDVRNQPAHKAVRRWIRGAVSGAWALEAV